MIEPPLLVSSLITHAARHHGRTEIASHCSERDLHRYTYGECDARCWCLARGLVQLGHA
jgi:3-(methylthio)propionyl---CoA ligase